MAKATQLTLDQLPPTISTTDGTTSVTILSVPAFAASNGGQEITIDIVGYDFANNEVATAKIAVKLKNVSGTPTMVGTPVHLVPISAGSSSGLVMASVNVVISGTSLNVNVIGVAGRTIYWSATRWPSIQVLDGYTATNPISLFGIPAGGDLSNTYPNPTVSTVLGGQTPVSQSTVLGGDLDGYLPNPTVVKIQGRSVASTTPTNGYSFIWNSGASQWQPSNALAVGGDLSNTADNAVVIRLQGREVNSTPPGEGDVLTYTSGAWKPLPTGATVSIAGDVTGTVGATTVAKIQNRTVVSDAPQPGDLLVWNDTNTRWEPNPITQIGGTVYGSDKWVNVGIAGDIGVGHFFIFTPEADFSLAASAVTTGGGVNLEMHGGRGKSNGANAGQRAGGLVAINGGDGYNDGTGGSVTITSGTSANGTAGDIQLFLGDGAAASVGKLILNNIATSTSASGGSASALPGLPQGYISINLGATTYKIPYYAV